MSSSSAKIFAPLYNFLKTSFLDKITTSSIITQQWNCFKIQLENKDFDCLIKLLKDMKNKINNNKPLNNITLLKDKIKKKDTPSHKHILTTISNIDINKISNDDLLYIGVIDLSSEKNNIPESNYESLVGKKTNIRNLSKDIEDDHIKKRIAGGITNILLQEIKLNALQKVFGGSENTLVEIIACLIDMAMYHLSVDYKNTDEDEIYHNHNKLVQLYLDSTKELVKKYTKETFYQNYIGFRINIAGSLELSD
ncbi:hypothetical protein GLOIN_2v1510726 [Rhizophagus clarus]|uniref:Uncharacterized protein n=1 Tax=Rhizophagus clarus TaxID=94130 RepID=A0A8H3M9D9_9GLOM|nr:hypothetical protein GLOIN_2v1510726 [Rhizophagus clarus]